MLRTWLVRFAGHVVDRVGEVLPRPADALHFGLAAEFPFRADFARHARDFRSERAELVDHRVDRVLQFQDLAANLDGDLLGEVAVGDGGRDLGDVAHLAGEVPGHGVDRLGEVLPGSGHALDVGLPAQFSLGADFAGHARDFRGERGQLGDHRVHGLGGAQELALERTAVEFGGHGQRKIAAATAPMTRAISLVGCTRSVIRELTDSVSTPHWPEADGT